MVNPQHIEWLREGVESWNARRSHGSFKPDFEGANIAEDIREQSQRAFSDPQGANLEGISLHDSVLRRADFSGLHLPSADLGFSQAQESVFQNSNLNGAELDGSDFSGAIFDRSSLKKASIDNVNLTGANFDRSQLQDAMCWGSNFTGANLRGASLIGAKLAGANLTGANLTGADLTGADLTGADLSEATLISANVKDANLKGATLAGVVVTGTQLWNASLYQTGSVTLERSQDLTTAIASVAELLEVCRRLTEDNALRTEEPDQGQAPVLYFRGHALADWQLRPSVTRSPSYDEPDVRGKEGEILTDLMSRRPEEFGGMTSALSQWVLAQHHRLKTRLLDITRNPLVALFFVCVDAEVRQKEGALHLFVVPHDLVKPFNSDSISVVANLAKLPPLEQDMLLGKPLNSARPVRDEFSMYSKALTRLYHHIGSEKPYFKERIDPRDLYRIFVAEPERSVERLRAQSGAFLISAFHERFEPEEIRSAIPDLPLYEHYKILVPADCKETILRELSLLNVTRETLFPGLDEATQAVMRDHTT